jgi:hypothetical protein
VPIVIEPRPEGHRGASKRPTPLRSAASGDDTGKVAEQLRARARVQVRIIQDAYDGQIGVGYPGGSGDGGDGGGDTADFEYLYRQERLLVRDVDVDRVLAALTGAEVEDALVNGLTRISLPEGADVGRSLEELDRVLGVGVATPDHVLWVTPGSCCPATEPQEAPSSSAYPRLSRWGQGGAGVLVSVVDTGWHPPAATDPLTPWLAGVTGDPEVIDTDHIHEYAGHGTFVAGVVRCEAPSSEIRVEGFLTHGGAVLESEIVRQLIEALALGPDIISLSAGSTTRGGRPLLSFDVFHDNFLSKVKGTVLVAAAGNDSTRRPFWPAAFDWAVSVGAVDENGQRATFSNFGSWVDVYALGVDMVNAYPHGSYTCVEPPNVGEVRHFEGLCQWSGTSFSTPLVAGKIAARMSRTGLSARHAADQLLHEARANAVPGVGPVL